LNLRNEQQDVPVLRQTQQAVFPLTAREYRNGAGVRKRQRTNPARACPQICSPTRHARPIEPDLITAYQARVVALAADFRGRGGDGSGRKVAQAADAVNQVTGEQS
jgi:hypothetical protein